MNLVEVTHFLRVPGCEPMMSELSLVLIQFDLLRVWKFPRFLVSAYAPTISLAFSAISLSCYLKGNLVG